MNTQHLNYWCIRASASAFELLLHGPVLTSWAANELSILGTITPPVGVRLSYPIFIICPIIGIKYQQVSLNRCIPVVIRISAAELFYKMQRFPATKCRGDFETELCDCINIHDASWNITGILMLFQLGTNKLIKNRLWLTSVLEMTIPQCSTM